MLGGTGIGKDLPWQASGWFEAEIGHLGDYCNNLCVLGSSGDGEKRLDSVLKEKPNRFWIRTKKERESRANSRCLT